MKVIGTAFSEHRCQNWGTLVETTDSERVCINDLKHRPTNSNKQTNKHRYSIFVVLFTHWMLNLCLVRIRWAFHACFIIILYFRKLRFLSWSIYLFRWEHVLLLQDIKNQKSRRKWSNKKKVWDNFCDIYKLVTAHKNCYQLGLWNVGWNFVTNWIRAKNHTL